MGADLKKLFRAYVAAKQHDNVLDYDDLLLYLAQMMAEPALARLVGERFDHVWSTSTRIRMLCRRRSYCA